MPGGLEVSGLIVAGLGLFFIGIRLIGTNLRMMAGRGFRLVLAKLTNKGWLSGLVGILAGGITQSTSAVTFIMTGMISAGLVSTRRAMPLVLWSNAGNCILVFLAVINFHLMILYLLGLVGFLFYCDLDRSKIMKPLVGGLLGVVLLFLGLDFIKLGAKYFKEFDAIVNFVSLADNSYLLGLLIAGFLSFFVQSAATVSAIAIALANTGILTLDDTLMVIYGTNLGPALSTWVLARKLIGAPKRLAMFQVLFKFLSLIVFVLLFYAEVYLKIPLVASLLTSITPQLTLQLALAYLGFQIFGAVLLTIFMEPINRWLLKKYPTSREDQLSRPQYMTDEAVKEPELAVVLLEREQTRVLKRFPSYLDSIRKETRETENPRILHSATVVLCHELDAYFHELLKKNMSQRLIDKVLNLQNRMEIILGIEESLYEVVFAVREQTVSEGVEHFMHSITESIHLLLLTLIDVVTNEDVSDRKILDQLTEDRGDLIKHVHDEVRTMHPKLNLHEQRIFDTLSSRFERIVWMVRYLNKIVDEALSKD